MTSILDSVTRIATRRRVALVLAGAAVIAVLAPAVSARSQAAPVNTAEPTITGTAAQGQTLNATTGTWNNSPTSFAYEWRRCPPSGGASDASDCAVIGATTASYVVAAGDVGFRLRVKVTASSTSLRSEALRDEAIQLVRSARLAPVE